MVVSWFGGLPCIRGDGPLVATIEAKPKAAPLHPRGWTQSIYTAEEMKQFKRAPARNKR